MLYKKEFAITPYGGAFLKNPEPAIAYIKEKLDRLLKTKDDHTAQRDVKCQIFRDFKTIYEYDLNNAVFPEPFGTFASKEAKEQLIKQKLSIPARDGYKISGYLIEPEGHENDSLPVILFCHGGAFFLTMMPNQLDMASVLAKELQCRVFVPQYRTSLDAPYPIPLHDCYDVLQFIAADPRTDSEKILTITVNSLKGNIKHLQNINWKSFVNPSDDDMVFSCTIPISSKINSKNIRAEFFKE